MRDVRLIDGVFSCFPVRFFERRSINIEMMSVPPEMIFVTPLEQKPLAMVFGILAT